MAVAAAGPAMVEGAILEAIPVLQVLYSCSFGTTTCNQNLI
jgi:hypothetical protein